MERIKVNFNLGGLRIEQGEIETLIPEISNPELTLDDHLNSNEYFIKIYNEFGDSIRYNKNSIKWICVQRED
ncbi:hypothetical protein H3018_gp27 [Bacillus phage DK3]|nr:hypothetical protein H3018_gp27 [Bacillus phage DK3]AZU99825.1 hypothetical protein DK3_000027 [Bacillus phage DK3]